MLMLEGKGTEYRQKHRDNGDVCAPGTGISGEASFHRHVTAVTGSLPGNSCAQESALS